MSEREIESFLRQTLDDGRLTRGERASLAEHLEATDLTPQNLAYLRAQAFQMARSRILGGEIDGTLGWLEAVVKLLQPESSSDAGGMLVTAEACFAPADDCVLRLSRMLEAARAKIDICVFTITDDRLTRSIRTAHNRGVRIRVISDNDKSADLGSDIEELSRAGVPVRVDRTEFHMHHKFAVFDAQVLVSGSYNWTRGAARDNKENLLITPDPLLIARFTGEFERLWNSFAP